MWRVIGLLLAGVLGISSAWSVTVDPNLSKYKVYQADLNTDGKLDYYFQGIPLIILLHGDVATPIVLPAPASFVVYSQGTGFLLPMEESYTESQLATKNLVASSATPNTLQTIIANATIDPNSNPGSIASPVTPQIAVAPAPASTIDATRALPAEFDVTNNGQATYKIPVITAPGSAGLVPNVSLNYSSGAGNGNMGLGWSLSAYGVISRCRQTEGIDGVAKPITWTSEDRFCLNGDRLLLASGTYGASGSTYKTEIDSFARITAVGGVAGHPDYFTVEYKDGIIETYGNTTDSYYSKNQLSSGNANTVLDWALSKRSDSAGNKIVFNYINDVDGQRIDTIDYAFGLAATRGAYLQFNYESRNDPISGYVAGYAYKTGKRLAGVRSYNGTTEIRNYIITYNQGSAYTTNDKLSRVNRVQECVGSVCSPATEFEWELPDYQLSETVGSMSFFNGVSSHALGDINGDGLQDLVWFREAVSPSGYNPNLLMPRELFYATGYIDTDGAYKFQQAAFDDGTNVGPSLDGKTLRIEDVNGDGRMDVIVSTDYYHFDSNLFKIYKGSNEQVLLSKPMPDGSWRLGKSLINWNNSENESFTHLDANGDGLVDLMTWEYGDLPWDTELLGSLLPGGNSVGFSSVKLNLNKSSLTWVPMHHILTNYTLKNSFNLNYMDYQGDADFRSDMGAAPINNLTNYTGDFNGDGRIDVLAHVHQQYGGCNLQDDTYRYCGQINDPNITPKKVIQAYILSQSSGGIYQLNHLPISGVDVFETGIKVVDLNNDGLSDILSLGGSPLSWSIRISDGLKINPGINTGILGTTFSMGYGIPGGNLTGEKLSALADINADGYQDFIWHQSNGTSSLSGVGSLQVRYWDPSTNQFEAQTRTLGSLSYTFLQNYYSLLDNQHYSNFKKEDFNFNDVNGDNIPDLVVTPNVQAAGSTISIRLGKNTKSNANKIVSFSNGLGEKKKVFYQQINSSSHYDRISGITGSYTTQQKCESVIQNPGEEEYMDIVCWDVKVGAVDSTGFYKEINDPWYSLAANEQSLRPSSPVMEAFGPMSVVTDVEVSAPGANTSSPGYVDTASTAKLSYYYGQAKMQAGGRGFLGFRYFTVVNRETGTRTETEYRQDWPYIGQPRKIKTFTTTGHKLSEQENTWGLVNCHDSSGNPNASCVTSMSAQVDASGSGALGALQPFLRKSVTHTYALKDNGISQGDLVSTSIESTVYDNKGNTVRSESIVSSPLGLPTLNKTTINTYDYSGSTWSMQQGRLQRMTVAANEPTYGTITRTSSFTYYTSGADIGLLNTETVEPDNSAFTVTTIHYYNKGNRYKSVTTAEGQMRQTEVEYDSLGRYVDKTYGFFTNGTAPDTPVRQLESQVVSRDKYGTPTEVRSYVSASGYVTKKVATTAFGTPYFTADSTGALVEIKMGSGIDANNICPSDNKIWITIRSAGGAMSIECKDILGRTRRTGSIGFDGSDWSLVDKEYDKLGRVLHTSSPYWRNSNERYWTSQSYDILGRVTATKTPYKNSYLTTTTSYTNLEVRITNPKNQVRIEKRDLAGQVYEVVDPNNGVTKFAYDARGNMREMRDPASNITAIGYDLRDRKTSMNDPDKGSWIYKYNRFGDLICQMDGSGQISVQRYDIAGRMFSRTDRAAGGNCDNPTGTVDKYSQWTYDTAANGLGQLASVHDSASVSGAVQFQQTYSYDNLGRVSGTTTTMPGHGGLVGSHYEKITYDQFGRVFQTFDAARTGASFATNGIQNVYNSYGYLNKVVDAVSYNGTQQAYYTVNQINARGNITSANYGNGVTQLADYYPESGLTKRLRANRALASLPIQDLELDWDEVGNLGWRHETGTASDSVRRNIRENFTYDSLNRLRTWTTSGDLAASETANYNNIDNITDKTGIGNYLYGTQCGSGTNAGPHALCRAGTTNYFYDKNGNMLNDSAGRTMKYTTYDLPKEITKGGHKTEFSYGPNRARYKRVDTSSTNQVTTSLYLGSVEKVYYWDGSIQWKRNIAGVAQITQTVNNSGTKLGEAQRYFIKDHLGSIGLITDEIGAAEQTNFFDPWGRERKIVTSGSIKQWLANNDNYRIASKPITTRGFTGHEQLAEVGLIHMNGRIYDGTLGRFVQADPIIQDPLRVQSLNRYSYVWNNPLNATDPSGFECDETGSGNSCEAVKREQTEENVEEVKVTGKRDDRSKSTMVLTFVSGTISGNSFSGYALRGQGHTAFVSEDIVNKYTGGDLKNITQKVLNKIIAGAAAKNSLAVVSAAAAETDVSIGDVLMAIAPFFVDPNQMMGDMYVDAMGYQSDTATLNKAAAQSVSKIEDKLAGAGSMDKVTLTLLTGVAAVATIKKVAKSARNLPLNDADRLTEINKTLERIESGGPFPHKKDGTIFKNKEGKLPEGNYREYTVDTPGATDRGARRVVQDMDTGKTYYTEDHYVNFIQIDPKKR